MTDSLFSSLYENDIIEFGGVLFADMFAFKMPRLVCSTLDSYLYCVYNSVFTFIFPIVFCSSRTRQSSRCAFSL